MMPGRPGKLSDHVVAQLESQILRGELEVDSRLPTEAELCEQLGVSRSVVRDAIRTLAARGLVQVRHGHGMVVAAPNDTAFAEAMLLMLLRSNLTVGDVLAARSAIEAAVCPIAAIQSTPADRERLTAALKDFEAAVESGDWQRVNENHLRFHLDLLGATNLPALEILLRPMQHVVLLSSLPPKPDVPEFWEVEAHRSILSAVMARDEEATRLALRDHYRLMEGEAYGELRATPFRESPAVHEVLLKTLRNTPASRRGGMSEMPRIDLSAVPAPPTRRTGGKS